MFTLLPYDHWRRVHALHHAHTGNLQNRGQGDIDTLPEAIAAIRAQGSLDYSRARAVEYAEAAERALDGLEDNEAVAALRGLARYAIERDH